MKSAEQPEYAAMRPHNHMPNSNAKRMTREKAGHWVFSYSGAGGNAPERSFDL